MSTHSGAPHIQTQILGLTVNLDTLFSVWAVMLFVLFVCLIATRSLKKQGMGGMQYILESIHDLWDGQIKAQITWNPRRFLPLIGGIFCFTVIAYWYGLLPWKMGLLAHWWPHLDNGHPWEGSSPTADLNVTAGMALVTVTAYLLAGSIGGKAAYWAPYFGLSWHHGKLSFNPVGLIEWLDLAIRPLTLSLRLFANTFAGEALVTTIVKLSLFVAPVLVLGFELGVGLLQAFIFSMLTTVYISIALLHAEDKHHSEEETGDSEVAVAH
jgi:F-type H+-transporting ATPase subunit a